MSFVTYKEKLKHLSHKLIEAQKPIRILNSIRTNPKWDEELIKSKFKHIPSDAKEFYESIPLGFDPTEKHLELKLLKTEIAKDRQREAPLSVLAEIDRVHDEPVLASHGVVALVGIVEIFPELRSHVSGQSPREWASRQWRRVLFFPGRGHRSAKDLGRSSWGTGHQSSTWRGPRRRRFRRVAGGSFAQCRRSHRRHRRSTAHEGQPDGRTSEDPSRLVEAGLRRSRGDFAGA